MLTNDSVTISNVMAFGMINISPILATKIPKKMGFLEMENKPFVISSVLFSLSIPILHEFAI